MHFTEEAKLLIQLITALKHVELVPWSFFSIWWCYLQGKGSFWIVEHVLCQNAATAHCLAFRDILLSWSTIYFRLFCSWVYNRCRQLNQDQRNQNYASSCLSSLGSFLVVFCFEFFFYFFFFRWRLCITLPDYLLEQGMGLISRNKTLRKWAFSV